MRSILLDKLGFLVRFWELKARHAALGQPLGRAEQIELFSFVQLVMGDYRTPPPGAYDRPDDSLPAQLIGEGTILPVEVRAVRAAALVVASPKPMTVGERVVVRTGDAVAGAEFTLPCTVAWAYDHDPCFMALVVDGLPTRSALWEPRAPGVALGVLSMRKQSRLVS